MVNRAQGTIEYLVILAVVVIVALIVVSLMINSTAPAGNISGGVSKLSTQSAPLAVLDATVNPDGNVYLKIGNKTGENVTVKSITVDNQPIPYEPNKLVATNTDQGFVIPTSITCQEGSPTSIEVVIEYDTTVSHLQDYPDKIIVNCETTEITDSTIGGETVVFFSCTGSVPPSSTLCAGSDTGLTSNTAITTVDDTCTGTKCEYVCDSLYLSDGSSCYNGCDPEAGVCTDKCGLLFADNPTGSWTYGSAPFGGGNSCHDPGWYDVVDDAGCDGPSVPQVVDGPCIMRGSGFNCPSFQRNGDVAVVDTDCCDVYGMGCYPGTSWYADPPSSEINILTHEYFTG